MVETARGAKEEFRICDPGRRFRHFGGQLALRLGAVAIVKKPVTS